MRDIRPHQLLLVPHRHLPLGHEAADELEQDRVVRKVGDVLVVPCRNLELEEFVVGLDAVVPVCFVELVRVLQSAAFCYARTSPQ